MKLLGTFVYLFTIVLWVSWVQAPWAFRARCFGIPSFRQKSQKLGHHILDQNNSLLREKMRNLCSHRYCVSLCQSWVYDESMFQPFLPISACIYFSFAQTLGVSLLLDFFQRELFHV